jgi:hypothetical protein
MKSRQSPQYKPADDYYTPKPIFDALGLTFDIDVCAPTGGVPWIPAKQSFDLAIDGLSQDWDGLVWCNPPYSKPGPWIDKFIEHGNGIMMVQVSRSKGFLKLWSASHGIVIPDHNMMMFTTIDGRKRCIFMPIGLFALGDVSYQALLASNLGRVR